jgi:alpha-beta hydrolase superfamily lysophospholipase
VTIKNVERPLPENENEGAFYTVTDGTQLFYAVYTPDNVPRKTIYIISGYTGINHITDRDIIEILGNETNRVVTIHPRGTGYSEGRRGDIKKFNLFINDYAEIINNDIRMNIGNEVILYGHSISTAIACAIGPKLNRINGIILVNPPYEMKRSPGMTPSIPEYIKYGFYMVFAPHTPIVNMGGDPSLIINIEEREEAIQRINDPLIVRYISMYMMNESRKCLESILNYAKEAEYPLLLIYGTEDSIIEKNGCDEIFDNWKHRQKEYLIVENGTHGKLTVLLAESQIREWINNL